MHLKNINNKKAFTLIEVLLAMVLFASFTLGLIEIGTAGIDIKNGQALAEDISNIFEAARTYYTDEGVWPADMSELQAKGYINPASSGKNLYNLPYTFSSAATTFTLTTNTLGDNEKVVASLLPLSSVSGKQITSQINATASASGRHYGQVETRSHNVTYVAATDGIFSGYLEATNCDNRGQIMIRDLSGTWQTIEYMSLGRCITDRIFDSFSIQVAKGESYRSTGAGTIGRVKWRPILD